MNNFKWPDLANAIVHEASDFSVEAEDLTAAWIAAFDGWEFSLPNAARMMVVKSASFYSACSGGVQLYTYIWSSNEKRWMAYARDVPSQLRKYAFNFRRAAE